MWPWHLISLLVAIVAVIAASFCFLLLPRSETRSFDTFARDFIRRHPEIGEWSAKALLRLYAQPNATGEDLSSLHAFLKDAQQNIHDFVQSPEFNTTAHLVIEKLVDLAEPILGVFPSSEMQKMMEIFMQDPSVALAVSKLKEDLRDAIKSFMMTLKQFDNAQVRTLMRTGNLFKIMKSMLQ